MSLEYILGVKAGIGETFQEAEQALQKASLLKPKIVPEDSPKEAFAKTLAQIESRKYAVVMYDGQPLEVSYDLEDVNRDAILEAIDNLKEVAFTYGEDSLAYQALERSIENQSYDRTTGALTNFGYMFELCKREELSPESVLPEGVKRYIVLFDANDMHYWNSNAGYDNVTDHIAAIGKALVDSSRGVFNIDKTDKVPDIVIRVPFVNRTHGSAGDEFMIDPYCHEDHIGPVVERLVDQIYQHQKELC
ncbi:MAG: hypothetical protein ABIG93_00270 [archaeon]|nr:hypothetical protein [Nanoarchaeota archaeon]